LHLIIATGIEENLESSLEARVEEKRDNDSGEAKQEMIFS
jgi:hypothetical protein